MTGYQIRLSGLDPLDPLGYLAALGVLAALSDRTDCTDSSVQLRYEVNSWPRPILLSHCETMEQLAEEIMADLRSVAGFEGNGCRDAFLDFAYPGKSGKLVRDLKPDPELLRRRLFQLLTEPHPRRTLDWFAATMTDVATDNNGATKPFALHFTAGQQAFLGVAHQLIEGDDPKPKKGSSKRAVDTEDILIALAGPWPDDRGLKVFSWSPTQDRAYAHRAEDPATDKKQGTPGADWLAFRGLCLLSSAPVGSTIQTGGIHGGWKSGTWTVPIWAQPLNAACVRSLLRHPCNRPPRDHASGAARSPAEARTIPPDVELLTFRIMRSDQGGYGSFSRPTRHEPFRHS